jgi:DNA-binding TFAR19-related protein (PDSD5 family)
MNVRAGHAKEDLKKVRLSRKDLAQERELLVAIDAGVITIFVSLTVVLAVYLAVAET